MTGHRNGPCALRSLMQPATYTQNKQQELQLPPVQPGQPPQQPTPPLQEGEQQAVQPPQPAEQLQQLQAPKLEALTQDRPASPQQHLLGSAPGSSQLPAATVATPQRAGSGAVAAPLAAHLMQQAAAARGQLLQAAQQLVQLEHLLQAVNSPGHAGAAARAEQLAQLLAAAEAAGAGVQGQPSSPTSPPAVTVPLLLPLLGPIIAGSSLASPPPGAHASVPSSAAAAAAFAAAAAVTTPLGPVPPPAQHTALTPGPDNSPGAEGEPLSPQQQTQPQRQPQKQQQRRLQQKQPPGLDPEAYRLGRLKALVQVAGLETEDSGAPESTLLQLQQSRLPAQPSSAAGLSGADGGPPFGCMRLRPASLAL